MLINISMKHYYSVTECNEHYFISLHNVMNSLISLHNVVNHLFVGAADAIM